MLVRRRGDHVRWVVLLMLLTGCSDGTTGPRGGTETNVQGVPCTSDAQCGEELRCLPVIGAAEGGMVCQKPSP